MATVPKASATTLFNDSVLSDVKITQIFNGKRREYYAHKAILCSQSSYFMKAFTGRFKEASELNMELHEDDPDHFEFVLKFMYTLHFDINAITSAVNKDQKDKTVLYILGVYKVAEKYDVGRMLAPTADYLRKVITEGAKLESVIEQHYGSCPQPGRPAGSVIASAIIGSCRQFVRTPKFPTLLVKFPVFAADIALCYHKEGLFSIRRVECKCGAKSLLSDFEEIGGERGYTYCVSCKSKNFSDSNSWE